MAEYLVEFERIGTHRPPPLTVTAETGEEVAEAVYRYARPMLGSRDVNVLVNLDEARGFIVCGVQSGGRFTVKERASVEERYPQAVTADA